MSDAPVKKGRGRPPKAKPNAEKVEKPAKTAKTKDEPVKKVVEEAKDENGAKEVKKGRGQQTNNQPKSAEKSKAPKRPAGGSGKGRGRPPKNPKKVVADDSAEDSDKD